MSDNSNLNKETEEKVNEQADQEILNEAMEAVILDKNAQNLENERIREYEEEIARLKDQWARAMAETENVRKRAKRDVEETSRYANANFAKDMIDVAENLHRALESTPEDARNESPMMSTLCQGVEMTLNALMQQFEKYQIKRIFPLGEKFDHNIHQAVAQVETPESPAGSVIQVLQAGYIMHDRLLRPAMVTVAKSSTSDAQKTVDTTA